MVVNHLFSGRSVAIIGSSPEILDRQQGTEIDAHDVVMRINLHGIHGRPECMGSRTDVRFLGGRIDKDLHHATISETAKASALILRKKNRWVMSAMPVPAYFAGLQMYGWLSENKPELLDGINTGEPLTSGSNAIAIALDNGASKVTLFGFSMNPESRWKSMTHTGSIVRYDSLQLRRYHCDPEQEIKVLRRVMQHYPVAMG